MFRPTVVAALLALAQQPASNIDPDQRGIEECITKGNDANKAANYSGQRDAFAEALPLSRKSGWRLAEVLNGLGAAEWRLGDIEAARQHFMEALDAWGSDPNKVPTLSMLGLVLCQSGDCEAAIEKYQEAYALTKRADYQATLLNNMATAYSALGDFAPAAKAYEQSAALLRQAKDDPRAGQALVNLASVRIKMGDPQTARSLLSEALPLVAGNRRTEGDTLNYMGRALTAVDQPTAALGYFDQSLVRFREVKEPRGEASALFERALALHRLGRSDEALEGLDNSLRIRERLQFDSAIAETWAARAEIHLDRGEPELARTAAEQSIRTIESVRASASNEQSRASYLASKQGAYETWVEALMQLHESKPDDGFEELAFGAAEQGRARTLLELLRTGSGEVRLNLGPAVLEEQRRLLRRLRFLSRRPSDRAQYEETERQYVELEMRIRAASPSYAAIAAPRILSIKEVAALLDADTQMIEFFLGRRRSFAWVIGKGQLCVVSLPARSIIEPQAREVARAFARPTANFRSPRLSRTLFDPIKQHLSAKRLIIVPDGALQYVTFAALRLPGETGSLISRFEISQSPSASVLGELRRRASPVQTKKMVAVISDPVYEAMDSRLPAGTRSAASVEPLARLAFSFREGKAIASLGGAGTGLTRSGLGAQREIFTDGSLRGHAIVHLSSHALVDAERPERSGLALSFFDKGGRPVDGMLRLYDMYRMQMDADLVVLSACNTGIGKELRGEGMIGFSRAFFHSGARSLIVSLWPVDDEASAQLMTAFYRHLLLDRLSAPAALRAAQLAIMRTPRWRAPYFWAGFTAQGDTVAITSLARTEYRSPHRLEAAGRPRSPAK